MTCYGVCEPTPFYLQQWLSSLRRGVVSLFSERMYTPSKSQRHLLAEIPGRFEGVMWRWIEPMILLAERHACWRESNRRYPSAEESAAEHHPSPCSSISADMFLRMLHVPRSAPCLLAMGDVDGFGGCCASTVEPWITSTQLGNAGHV